MCECVCLHAYRALNDRTPHSNTDAFSKPFAKYPHIFYCCMSSIFRFNANHAFRKKKRAHIANRSTNKIIIIHL